VVLPSTTSFICGEGINFAKPKGSTMTTTQKIADIAHKRLTEARLLFSNGMYDGAFYLSGYSAELMLKAKVCTAFCIPNLLDDDCKELNAIEGIAEIRKVVKTHRLYTLLILSGLKTAFESITIDSNSQYYPLGNLHRLLFQKWSENARYNTVGTARKEDVEELLNLLSGNNGFLKWIAPELLNEESELTLQHS